MTEPLPGIPGDVVGEDRTPGYRKESIPVRVVDPRVALYISDLVNAGELAEEEAMRLLFPEVGSRIYDLEHNRAR